MTLRCWNEVGAALLRAIDAPVVAWLVAGEPPYEELENAGVRRVHVRHGQAGAWDGDPRAVVHDGTFDPAAEPDRLDLAVLDVQPGLEAVMAEVRALATGRLRPLILLAGLGADVKGSAAVRGELQRFCSGAPWELVDVPGEEAGILAAHETLDGAAASLLSSVLPPFVRRRFEILEEERSAAATELTTARRRNDDLRRQTERADRLALASERRAAELSTALDDAVRAETRALERAAQLEDAVRAAQSEAATEKRSRSDLAMQLAAAEGRLAAWEAARDELLAMLRQVAGSRAWRWGHATTRLLRRLTFRKAGQTDGVRDAVSRVEAMPLGRRRG